MPAAEVPHLVKHNTIAIWRDGGISGGNKERFVSAWNIARARLVQYGFLAKGSEAGKARDIKLTSKGAARNRVHAREADGKAKSALFDEMFRWVEVAEDLPTSQQKTPGSTKPASTQERGDVAKIKQDTAIVGSRLDQPKRIEKRTIRSRKAPHPTKPTKPTSIFDRKRPK